MHSAIIFGVVVSVAFTALANDIFLNTRNTLNDRVEEIIPKDARKFYNELSLEDKQVLQEVFNNSTQFGSFDAVLEILKSRSTVLYEKFTSLASELKESIDSLGPDAKEFVETTVVRLREIGFNVSLDRLKTEFLDFSQRFRQLPSNSRDEIRNAFPVISGVVENPIFRTLLTMFFGIQFDNYSEPIGPTVTVAPVPSIDIEPPVARATTTT